MKDLEKPTSTLSVSSEIQKKLINSGLRTIIDVWMNRDLVVGVDLDGKANELSFPLTPSEREELEAVMKKEYKSLYIGIE